ncbi:MAG: hypothetical protein ACRYFX_23070 [Janthinobacterium lividum]
MEIRITEVKGSRPFTGKDLQKFKKVVDVYAQEIHARFVAGEMLQIVAFYHG